MTASNANSTQIKHQKSNTTCSNKKRANIKMFTNRTTQDNLKPPVYASNSPLARGPWPHSQDIAAFDVPQWKWSNEQCRTWIYKSVIEQFGWPGNRALEAAVRFKGCGIKIFTSNDRCWELVMGSAVEGRSLRSFIFSVRNEKGAVPRGTRIP
jgi:hypothetical protein